MEVASEQVSVQYCTSRTATQSPQSTCTAVHAAHHFSLTTVWGQNLTPVNDCGHHLSFFQHVHHGARFCHRSVRRPTSLGQSQNCPRSRLRYVYTPPGVDLETTAREGRVMDCSEPVIWRRRDSTVSNRSKRDRIEIFRRCWAADRLLTGSSSIDQLLQSQTSCMRQFHGVSPPRHLCLNPSSARTSNHHKILIYNTC